MHWHEWVFGGVLLSPYLVAALLAVLAALLVQVVLHRTALARHLWHEALFGAALFVCLFWAVVEGLSHV